MIGRPSPSLVLRSRHICQSCVLRLYPQRRVISQKYLEKQLDAKLAWAKKAAEIQAGKQESMLAMLENRGYVNQIVGDRDDLDRLMTKKRVGIYVGVDPTAASLHVGHLLPLMVLYWAYIKGFHACSLLGGATAQIGDPIGRTASRDPQRSSERKINMAKIHFQLKAMWRHVEKRAETYGYCWEWAWRRELTNNNAWLNRLPFVDLLKYLGNDVRLGTMLGRDTVKNRMKQGQGMSFAEFTYPLLQSWDWWYMYDTKDIQVQVGGADQFGNILAGVEAINHIRHRPPPRDGRTPPTEGKEDALLTKPIGFTVPLLTTASGEKFGKSAGNAIWLDKEMTSPFELYQFFVRMADADVHRYLKLFTFESLDALEILMEEHRKEPSKRVAQHKLAREILEIVHGSKIAEETEQEHRSLFKRPPVTLPQPTTEGGIRPQDINRHVNKTAPIVNAENAPSYSLTLPRSLVYNQQISKVIYHGGLVASRSEGHRMVANRGVYIGARPGSTGTMGDQVDFSPALNWDGKETEKYIIDGEYLMIRIGKWKVKIIKIISDDEFEAQGLTAPGWKEEKPDVQEDVVKMSPRREQRDIKQAPPHQKGVEAEAWDKPLSSYVP